MKKLNRFCAKGHDTFVVGRARTNHECKACLYESWKIWVEQNHQRVITYDRTWRNLNRGKVNAYARRWRKKHAYARRWRKKHARQQYLKVLECNLKRKHRVPIWGQEGILEFYLKCPPGMEVDHLIPLCGKIVSGLHVIWNLQYLPANFNRRKSNSFDGLSQDPRNNLVDRVSA